MFFQKYQLNLLQHEDTKTVRNVEVYIPTIFIDAVIQNVSNGDHKPNMLYHKNLGESVLTTLSLDMMEKIENKSSDISYIYMTKKTLKTIKTYFLHSSRLTDGKDHLESIDLRYIGIDIGIVIDDDNDFRWTNVYFDLKFTTKNSYGITYTLKSIDESDLINQVTILPIIRPLIKSLYDKIHQLEETVENLQMQLLYMPPGGGEMYHKAKQNFETLSTQ